MATELEAKYDSLSGLVDVSKNSLLWVLESGTLPKSMKLSMSVESRKAIGRKWLNRYYLNEMTRA